MLTGKGMAVFAVSRWEGALDVERAERVLGGETAAVRENERAEELVSES
ncbi:hypothetical protein ABZ357_23275 [Streptomyces sp. NPDC005917]